MGVVVVPRGGTPTLKKRTGRDHNDRSPFRGSKCRRAVSDPRPVGVLYKGSILTSRNFHCHHPPAHDDVHRLDLHTGRDNFPK